MAEATNTEQQDTTPNATGAPEQGAKADANTTNPETGKTYTEAELNAIVSSRLSKHEKSLKSQFEKERQQAEERAKLSEAERIQAEKADLEKQLEQLRAEKTEATQRASLAGKVADLDYALFKAQQNADKYISQDGTIDVDALLKDHDNLRAQPTPKPGPAPTNGGGNPAPSGLGMNTLIRKKAGR